jgi:DNA-directed RNA polymerase specialized sigma24 family protein
MATTLHNPVEPTFTKLPPELEDVKDQLVDCYLEGIEYAGKYLRYRPAHLVKEVVHRALLQITTTHRWEKRGPLRTWFLILVTNQIREIFKTRDRVVDHSTASTYRRHDVAIRRERVPNLTPEQQLIAREDAEAAEDSAPLRGALLAAIKASVEHNEVATGVIEVWEDGGIELKPRQLAERLGVGVTQIYRAKEVIQYQAAKCRERLGNQGDKS